MIVFDFKDGESLTCLGIAAKRREYRFAQLIGSSMSALIVEATKSMHELVKKTRELNTVMKMQQNSIDCLEMDNEDITLKLESADKRLGFQALEISRKTEKCADLSAEMKRLRTEFENREQKRSETKRRNENTFKELSLKFKKSMRENKHLRIEVDKLKSDADLQRDKYVDTIHKLQNNNQELQKELSGAQNFKTQAEEKIYQLFELFDKDSTSQSKVHVKELEDRIAALKTVNTELESISKKFEQVTSCSLCDEKYESTGERAPVKLKCSHIFCSDCVLLWLAKKEGPTASCPTCREPYRQDDIRDVNLNTDL